MTKAIKSVLCLGAALLVGACTSPQLRTTGEVSAEGLARMEGTNFDELWVSPGLKAAAFDRVVIEPTSVAYQEVGEGPRYELTRMSARRSAFPIPAPQRERIESRFRQYIAAAVDDSGHYLRVESPTSGVLQLRAALLEFVSSVPPEQPQYRAMVTSVGHATLAVELRDSQSGEVLVRAVKHDKAGPRGQQLVHADRVSAWPEMNRQLDRWARDVRGLLVQLHEMDTAS